MGWRRAWTTTPKHFLFGGRFAGPDFELAGALLDEHFYAGDGGDRELASEFEQRRVDGIVDAIEEIFCFEAGFEVGFGYDLGGLVAGHADQRWR